jgi:hypothetical protein
VPLDTATLQNDLKAIGKLAPKDPPDPDTPMQMLVAALERFVKSGEVTGVQVSLPGGALAPQAGTGEVI